MWHIVVVLRYRSGYLQWNILYDATVAAHIGCQCALQVSMMVGAQWRIVVISRDIVLRQIRLKLYRRLFIRIVKVFRLHFCMHKNNTEERERERKKKL